MKNANYTLIAEKLLFRCIRQHAKRYSVSPPKGPHTMPFSAILYNEMVDRDDDEIKDRSLLRNK